MDSNGAEGIKLLINFLKGKNPIFYVFFVLSICLYWFLFYYIEEPVITGFLGRSMQTKVFIILLATIFINIFIFDNEILRSAKGHLIKVLIVIVFFLLWIVFIIPAWSYSRYDDKKITSYIRIIPFGYAFSVKSKTIFYDDIADIKIVSGGGDSATYLRFYMKQRGKASLAIQGISDSELRYFYRTLYEQCAWLRDDIHKNFGNFLVENEKSINGKSFRFELVDIVFPFLILLTILQWFIIIKYIWGIFLLGKG